MDINCIRICEVEENMKDKRRIILKKMKLCICYYTISLIIRNIDYNRDDILNEKFIKYNISLIIIHLAMILPPRFFFFKVGTLSKISF